MRGELFRVGCEIGKTKCQSCTVWENSRVGGIWETRALRTFVQLTAVQLHQHVIREEGKGHFVLTLRACKVACSVQRIAFQS